MHRIFLFLLVALVVACSNKPVNLSDAKGSVMQYYESGQYDRDLKEIIDGIESDFDGYKAGSKDVVVFDVDETSLSNYEYIKSINFGYETELWNEYLREGSAECIKPVKNLYNWFLSKNIKAIFITGRSVTTYEATFKNLEAAGYSGFDTLICRDIGQEKLPAADYKSGEREKLVRQGYNIIATIGDLYSDLEGGNTGRKYKLPNYLYSF